MIQLRSTIFTVGYFLSGMVWGLLCCLFWIFPPLLRHRLIVLWTAFGVFWLRITCGITHEVQGKENLAAAGKPVIILSKHQSTWETLYLQQLAFPAITVLKRELLYIPFFGWGLRALRPIAIDRDNPRAALKRVKALGVERLQQGYNLVLFPEGTRSSPGQKQKYARSGADIAIDANIPIVPIAINSGVYWPRGGYRKKRGVIKVCIGEPIYPDGKDSKQLIKEVEDWIETRMLTLV